MYTIFLVEDDEGIAQGIQDLAGKWGFSVVIAQDFTNIMAEFAQVSPHLVLLDIALPSFNGYHWCSQIRKVSTVPILFLSSASDNMNMIMAMNLGADDFIAKPFDGQLLIAKIQALLRRSYDFSSSLPVLEHRGALLQVGNGSLNFDGQTLELTRNEYRILLCLMENKEQVVSRETLMEALWETDCFVDDNTLTVNINRLRRRLEAIGLEGFIKTKFGVGYYLA